MFLWSGVYAFSNVTLHANSAHWGGAIALDGAAPSGPVILNLSASQILGNAAEHGGGIWCWDWHATIHLTEVLLEGNTAVTHGGGIACYESTSDTFANVTFAGNHCDAIGGALWCYNSSPTFTGVIFSENTAARGGALSCYLSTPDLTYTTFFANSADDGGAIFGGDQTHYTLANVTLYQNSVADNEGAGIYIINSSLTAENSIVAFSPVGAAIRCGTNALADLTCCDVIGNTGGDWVGCIADQMEINGNFSLDPLFCGSQNPDEPFTLHEDSPCAPGNNPECGLVGAWPVGCAPTSSAPDDEPAREATTWGRIKAARRR
jgi:predicted outer membrane repeat protein